MIAKYGEPEKKPDGWGGFYNSFSGIRGEIRVSEGDTVTWVRVAGDSRYATKKGIRIGSTSDEVEAAYGTAERHVFTRDENNNPIVIFILLQKNISAEKTAQKRSLSFAAVLFRR